MKQLYANKFLFGFFLGTWYFLLGTSSAYSQVNANFSASPVTGCSPLIVQFTDLSTGNPTQWNWNWGTGTSTNQNPGAAFTTGVYTVTLTVTNGAFTDSEVKTAYIIVYNKPTAGFTMTDTACVGEVVTYTDASTISPNGAAIGTWNWDFGDGNTLTASSSPVTHAYSVPGTYPVSLSVTDVNGCGSAYITKNIVIVPAPNASFTASPFSACAPPLTVNFTNTSSVIGTTTYLWNFGNGNTSTQANPSNTYTALGTYNVTLVVNQNGCIDSVTIPNYITVQNIAASFAATPTLVCTGQSVTFNNTSVPSASTASWDFGDLGTSAAISPTHSYAAPGTYTVTLIAGDASGCLDTITGTVTVVQVPTASFIADTMAACNVPFTVSFTNTSSGGNSWSWNFGDAGTSNAQNPVHTYTAAGTYTVSLIVTTNPGGCIDTVTINNFIVISPPVASFIHAPDSGCVPLTVNFLSTSTSLIDPISTYSWSFGDGNNTVTGIPNTSHTYTATGVYTVTLIIQTANGCSDTVICPNCIKVGTPPLAGFTIVDDTVCYGLPVIFNDTSTGTVTGWYWSFGDGQFSFSQNPQHTYGDTGTYSIVLIAYNNGCADTSILDTAVILPPKAQFTYMLSCTNYYTVQFTDASEGADSLFWDFGDGSQDSSNILNPIHTYPSRGPITVTLTAFNYATGCNNVYTASFTIAEPIASYTAVPSGCYPFTANFTSTSQDANTYWWNFGDPSTTLDTSLISNPSYTYNNPAAYTVTLIITDVNGCKDTLQDTVKSLGPLPYFYADTLTGCKPFVVTFVDTSVFDSILVQWTWDFGDGTPIITTNNDSIIHTYLNPGLYSVTMTVKDTNGCVKTIVKTNYIQPTYPFPAFTVDTFACKFDVLTYDASGTSVIGGTYQWDFGDGSPTVTTNAVSVTHAYTNDGYYLVTLTVTDTNGCDSIITDSVRILKPTAAFNFTTLSLSCQALVDTFMDASTGFVTGWQWYFGDGGSSTLQSPTHTYQTGGIYSVTLIVTNAGGCIDTLMLDSIIIVPFPADSFTLAPAAGCNPLKVCFDANGINTQFYIWDFGDGSVIQTISDTICHTYTSPGVFNPICFGGDTLPNGTPCLVQANNITGPVTVTNVINVSLSSPSVINLPIDSIIGITANYSGGSAPYTFTWAPDTGINCDTCTSILVVGTGDTIFYTFIIYDANGCIGIDSVLILSEPCFQAKLIPNVFSPNGDGMNEEFYIPGVCPNEKYSLQIYDRWGILLFSTTQRNNGWDGRTNAGVAAKEGTYYFVVTLSAQKDKFDNPIDDSIYKGFVTLVR